MTHFFVLQQNSARDQPGMRRRLFSSSAAVLILLFAALLPGCGKKILPVEKIYTRSKQIPSRDIVPPTQRPYRINGHIYYPLPSAYGYRARGTASWYGEPFHGRKTSCGETYDMYDNTAAHKTLPMQTHLLVRNLANGREAVVRVNDRGPFVKGRIIDLSFGVANKLGFAKKGVAPVELVALGEAVTYKRDNREVKRFLPHKDLDKGEFYVQIGSFTRKENALRLKDRMLDWGKKAVVQVALQGETSFYRVQVRAGRTLETADHMERVLTEAGFPGAFVVAR